MPHQIMHDTVSVHTTVISLREKKLSELTSLVTVLMRSENDERTYYSIAAAVAPCTDPAQDICIVHDITGDSAQAEKIFRRIADREVCPCTLEDVLSDML